MTITILGQSVFDRTGTSGPFTITSFAVPGGTSRLLIGVEYRGYSTGSAPVISSVTHNGDAVSELLDNAAGGYDDINTWWGQRASPDIGTYDIVVTFPSDVRGCKVWALAISGEKATGSILGQSSTQRKSTSSTATVGLGLTPATSGDSLILGSLAVALDTTLSSFTGTGFSTTETATYTVNGNLTATTCYRIGTAGALTISATFAAGSTDIGGSLVEILAEPTGTDVSGGWTTTRSMTGSTSDPDTARIADAGYRNGNTAQTEAFTLQPDVAGVDRRIVTAGPGTTPNLTIDQVAAGGTYRMRMRLADGQVSVTTATSTQKTTAHHLAFVRGSGTTKAYVSGKESISATSGDTLTGPIDLGTGGQAIGGHDSASPGAFTGIVGRYLLYDGEMTAEQVALLAMSEEDPDNLWGYGEEDTATESNQSPIACPLDVDLNGQSVATLTPRIVDPAGGSPAITAVTQPSNGTLAISGDHTLTYLPTAGWQGADSATYTVSDGTKSSTSKINITQARPSLKANGDAITVAQDGSVTFSPAANDIGAGVLRVTSVSNPPNGTATIPTSGTILYQPDTSYTGADSFQYTIQDEYSVATATVSVTVTSTSTPFVSASDDTDSTDKGIAVLISPLTNDTFSTGLGPLIVAPGSATAPSPSGTAVIQANQRDILYTPTSGFVGEATFNYTARSSVNTLMEDTALVRVWVNEPNESGLAKRPPDLSTVPLAQQRCVGFTQTGSPNYSGDRAGLVSALAASNQGDHIILNNGTYAGARVAITRAGSAGNFIVIRARNHLQAKINLGFDVNAANIWISGVYGIYHPNFNITDGSYKSTDSFINFNNKNFRFTNNKFDAGFAIRMSYDGESPQDQCDGFMIAYNTFDCNVRAAYSNVSIISILNIDGSTRAPSGDIAYNIFRQNILGTGASSDDRARHFITLHPSKPTASAAVNTNFKFHHNHMIGYVKEWWYFKRNVNASYNYCGRPANYDGTMYADFRCGLLLSTTYGAGGIWEGNNIDTTAQLVTGGRGQVLNGNRLGGSSVIQLQTGCHNINSKGQKNNIHDSTGYATLINNQVQSIRVGYLQKDTDGVYFNIDASQGGKPTNVRIFRGDAPTPTILKGPTVDDNDYSITNGFGGYPVITPVSGSSLLLQCGCD